MRLAASLTIFVLLPCAAAAQPQQRGPYLDDIDRAAEPCADFFQYANGAWRAKNPIPASMPRWSRRWAAGEASKERLKGILEEVSSKTDWPKGSVEQLIGDHYRSCMDEAAVNRAGLSPVKPLLAEIDKAKTPADVQKLFSRLHELAIWVPFGLVATPDNHEPTRVIGEVFASGLGLPERDYYLKPDARFEEARAKYRAHLAKMFQLAGRDEAQAKAASGAVFELETKLAGAQLDNVALRDPQATDHKTSFPELKKLTPHLDWVGYFREAGLAPADVNVDQPEFMRELDRQLAKTPVKTWKAYLQWHVISSAAPSLSKEFVDEDFAFEGAFLSGSKELKPRWKRCVESTDGLLGEALGKKYVEKYFPPEAKARMQEMVANLRLAMKETIQGLEWMGPETKQKALEKLATFNPKIGYPDKWKDYSQVVIRPGAHWENVVAGRQFNVRDNRSTIGKPVDRGRWGMTPPTSDAYYNARLNEIVFPAGILQPPAFDMNASDAVNYGAIGVVIGHEFSHGFDDEGAQFDALGRLSNWWTREDLERFQQRTKRLADQFDAYFIEPGIHHNGKFVLGEAIGDLAGAKLAYRAYEISRRGKPAAPAIDGFTPEQQFFIAWGQFRGDEIRPETQRLMIQSDPHPIAKYRVIGPLSNLAAFEEAFKCAAGAPMTRPPEQRAEVW